MIKTFHKVWLLVFLLFSVVYCYGWDYGRYINFEWTFETDYSLWEINPELSYQATFRGIEFPDITEAGYYHLMTMNFHPKHYAVNDNYWYEGDTMFIPNTGHSSGGHDCKIIYKINFQDHNNFHLYDVEEEITDFYETDYKVYLSLLYSNLDVIKSIEVYADVKKIVPEYDFYIWIKSIELTNLVWLNPEYEELCEAYVIPEPYRVSSGMTIDLNLSLYYGHPTQEVDIYIVFYNGTNLYFFPDVTTQPIALRGVLPHYTMNFDYVTLGMFDVDSLNLRVGENYCTIGIAPSGTMNFFNYVHPVKIFYNE